MKKAFALFTVVIVMGVMVWEKTSRKAVESKLFLDKVEALASGENSKQYRLFPCPHSPWNECVVSDDLRRESCSSSTHC